jgi:transcriptional regulator with XRE-family HTH domain
MMQGSLAERLRILRAREGLTLTEASERIGITRHTLSSLERGGQEPHYPTLHKIADGYGIAVEDLLEEPVLAGELEDGPSLEELHAAAGCETDWLVCPEARWAAWPRDPRPREAMQRVRETAIEFAKLKPLMDEQERGLPWSQKAFGGRYQQAWRRYFDTMLEAKARGVAAGVITEEGTLDDLQEKLGEPPGHYLEALLRAS